MSRYFSKIVLSLLIAAPLVLVPSFSANANPPANATSAPSTPHTPPPPPSNPLPNPSLAPKDADNSVTPPDGVFPIYEVDSNYMQSEIEELQAKVDAQDDQLRRMSGLLAAMIIILAIMMLVRSFRSKPKLKPKPPSASEEKPKYGLNV